MKLYGVRYGKDFKYVGPDFPFLYYLVEIEGHFFMFDTTFSSQELAEAMGVNLFLIDRELKEVFGQIPNIDSIIITHSHWDHINDIWKYPDAKIYISRVGYELAMKDGDSQVKERLIAGKSQLILIEDEACIEERFHYWLIGGHSMDSAVVWFEEGGNTDWDKTFTGKLINYAENPDSIGYSNGLWYAPVNPIDPKTKKEIKKYDTN